MRRFAAFWRSSTCGRVRYSYEEYIIEDMCSDHPEDYITRIAVPVKPAGLR